MSSPNLLLVGPKRLWRFIVEQYARKQIGSDAFGDAFGKAEATIEQQLALEGQVIG